MSDDEMITAWRAGHLTVVGCDACSDCDLPLTPEAAVHPFARPFHDVVLCQECTDRRWEPDCHGL